MANFAFLTGYSYDNAYTFGSTLTSGLLATGLPNPKLTWERMAIKNLGIDYGLWGRKLYGSFDMFRRFAQGNPLDSALLRFLLRSEQIFLSRI